MKSKANGRRALSLLLAATVAASNLPVIFAQAQAAVPSRFAVTRIATSTCGDGSDGELYIAAGQTVTLPVATPHQSVVEKQYTKVTIEAGGVLTTSAPNAGLVLRILGDCTIRGTIDQSLKAPPTNPYNNYPYPAELTCGAGGAGGWAYDPSGANFVGEGGHPMAART
ncbi:MAG: hypothetical protein RR276_09450, partial [Angelakisella sp.]